MLHLRWIVSRSRGQARLHCGINACEIVSAEVQIKGCERLLEMIAAASADKRDDIQSTRPDPCNCELTRASPFFISNQAQLIYQAQISFEVALLESRHANNANVTFGTCSRYPLPRSL